MSSILRMTCLMCGAGLLLAAVSGCPEEGEGEFLSFDADLSGDAEVPPVTTDATGTSNITLDVQTGIGAYTISFSGLSGPVTGAHFHNAPAGENGGIIVHLTDDFAGDDDGFVQGALSFSAAQIAELRAGNIYINLHTEANPNGEIRGQYAEQP